MYVKRMTLVVAALMGAAGGGCEVWTGDYPTPTPVAGAPTDPGPTPTPEGSNTPGETTPAPIETPDTPTEGCVDADDDGVCLRDDPDDGDPNTPNGTPTEPPTPQLSECEPSGPSEVDEDGDGFASPLDCDDHDPDTYPGSGEVSACGCAVVTEVDATGETFPAGFETVQAAVDAASSGDCLLIAPGAYPEAVDLSTKELQIFGLGELGAVTLGPPGAGSTVTVAGAQTRGTRLSNLAIVGGSGSTSLAGCGLSSDPEGAAGGGICIAGASPTLERLSIQGGAADYGGGVFAEGGSPLFRSITVEGGVAQRWGGGMALFDVGDGDASPLVDVQLSDNGATFGGGLSVIDSEVTLTDVDLVHNWAQLLTGSVLGQGGGLFLNGGSLTATRLKVQANEASSGGGISLGSGVAKHSGRVVLTNALIVDNHAGYSGGGLALFTGPTSDLTLSYVTLANNSAEGYWGGLYLGGTTGSPKLTVLASILAYNYAPLGPMFIIPSDSGEWEQAWTYTQVYNPAILTPSLDPLSSDPARSPYVFVDNQSFTNDTGVAPGFRRGPDRPSHGALDYHLRPSAHARDQGPFDEALRDPDGSRSDLGAYGGPESFSQDRDCDGLPDDWEREQGLDATDPDDAKADADGDGLSNDAEFDAGTDAQQADTDGDSHSDGDEVSGGGDPLDWYRRPGGGDPQTARVPGDFDTLQGAFDAGGDIITVTLGEGILQGPATVAFREAVTLSGAGSERSSLEGGDDTRRPRPTVGVAYVETVSIHDLSLVEGQAAYGGGLNLTQVTDATLRDMQLKDNHTGAAGGEGGGAYVYLARSFVAEDLRVDTNDAAAHGGGLRVAGSSGAQHVHLSRLQIVGNHSQALGGGMAIDGVEDLQMVDCDVVGNASTLGGNGGGGMQALGVSGVVRNTRFLNNMASRHGGGVLVGGASNLTFKSSIFAENSGSNGGAIAIDVGSSETASVSGDHVTLAGNSASQRGGDVWMSVSGHLSLNAAILSGGAAQIEGDSLYLDNLGPETVDPATLITLSGGSLLYTAADPSGHGLQPEVAEALAGTFTPAAPTFTGDGSYHLALGSAGIDVADDLDLDGSAGDAGIYGGPDGGSWDLDDDGIPSYFWPGSFQDAPEGVEASGYEDESAAWSAAR